MGEITISEYWAAFVAVGVLTGGVGFLIMGPGVAVALGAAWGMRLLIRAAQFGIDVHNDALSRSGKTPQKLAVDASRQLRSIGRGIDRGLSILAINPITNHAAWFVMLPGRLAIKGFQATPWGQKLDGHPVGQVLKMVAAVVRTWNQDIRNRVLTLGGRNPGKLQVGRSPWGQLASTTEAQARRVAAREMQSGYSEVARDSDLVPRSPSKGPFIGPPGKYESKTRRTNLIELTVAARNITPGMVAVTAAKVDSQAVDIYLFSEPDLGTSGPSKYAKTLPAGWKPGDVVPRKVTASWAGGAKPTVKEVINNTMGFDVVTKLERAAFDAITSTPPKSLTRPQQQLAAALEALSECTDRAELWAFAIARAGESFPPPNFPSADLSRGEFSNTGKGQISNVLSQMLRGNFAGRNANQAVPVMGRGTAWSASVGPGL